MRLHEMYIGRGQQVVGGEIVESLFPLHDPRTTSWPSLTSAPQQFSSQVLGKPESLVLVKYNHNEALCFNGTFEPAFVLAVVSKALLVGLLSLK